MKKINKKDIITFISMFVLTCIIFIPFLKGHYATDTYNISNVGYHNYAINWSLKDGRIIMAIIGVIANKINITIEAYVFITLFCALVISNITVMVLNKIIKRYKQPQNIIQEIILILISYITIFNFMYFENMYFVECIVMATSVLLFIIAADILVQKNKKHIIKSLILTIIGVICYQGTIGIFFAFVILFSILKNKNNIKQIVIDLIKCGLIALVAVLLNIIVVKIIEKIFQMKQNRLGQISKIFNNILTIIVTLPNILQETCNLFPKNALLLFLSILTLIIIIYQINTLKQNNNILYKYIAILIITIAGSCTTYLLTLTSFYTGRLRNALGALVGIIFIFLYAETTVFEKKGKLNLLTVITLISFVIINIINCQSIMLQHKEVNRLEKLEVEEIEEYINQYEKSTGNKVTKIAKIPVFNNMDKTYFPNTKNKTSFTHNAVRTSWAADGVINFYTNRNLENVTITLEEKEFYMKNKETEREYKCIEDTLYVNIYMF